MQLKDFPGRAEHACYTVPRAARTRAGGSFGERIGGESGTNICFHMQRGSEPKVRLERYFLRFEAPPQCN